MLRKKGKKEGIKKKTRPRRGKEETRKKCGKELYLSGQFRNHTAHQPVLVNLFHLFATPHPRPTRKKRKELEKEKKKGGGGGGGGRKKKRLPTRTWAHEETVRAAYPAAPILLLTINLTEEKPCYVHLYGENPNPR